MSMVQCANGHFYNQQLNSTCPHCQAQGNKGKTIGLTPAQPQVQLDPWQNAGFNTPQPQQPKFNQPSPQPLPGFEKTVPQQPIVQTPPIVQDPLVNKAKPVAPRDEAKTIGMFSNKTPGGIDPVVGWLVCIAGNDRGADFRIHPEKNTIGRSENNDIRIAKDQTVSRDNHATIIYDPKKKNFRLLAGGGRGLVYVNEEVIDFSTPLKANDIIELGETKLMFVPLCGEHFDWSNFK
jgi:hypothetical protein